MFYNLKNHEKSLHIAASPRIVKSIIVPGSVYYKHRPRQIDKRIILPISTQDGEKVVGAATYVDGVVTVRIPITQANSIPIL